MREPLADEVLELDAGPLIDDPRIIVDLNPFDDPERGFVEIADETIAAAIAEAVGVALVPRADGTPDFARPLRASDLGGIAYLDLANQDVYDLAGMEVLTNLVGLDLSGNFLFPGDITNLFPGDGGLTGASHLQYLNLDSNQIDHVAWTSQFDELIVLSMNFNGGEEGSLWDVSPIRELDHLAYAGFINSDVSELTRLLNVQLLDDNPQFSDGLFEYDGDWRAANSDVPVVGDLYRFADARKGSPSVAFQSQPLDAGQYELLMSWRPDEANVSSAQVSVDAGDLLTADINQRVSPYGVSIGGFAFESVGVFDITDRASVRVQLSSPSADGLLISDALLIRPVGGPLLDIQTLDLRKTPLNEATRQIVIPGLDLASESEVRFTDASRPIWSGQPTALAGKRLERLTWNPSDFLTVNEDEFAFLLEDSLSSNLRAFGNLNVAHIEQSIDRSEASQVLIHARTGSGRVSSFALTAGFGGSIVEGQALDDLDKIPQVDVLAYLDWDDSATATAADDGAGTDLDGRFQIFTQKAGPSSLLATLPEQGLALVPPEGVTVALDATPDVLSADITLQQAFEFDVPPLLDEGDRITPKWLPSIEVKSLAWTVDGPNASIDDERSESPTIEFAQSGIYTITATADDGDRVYTRRRTVRVLDVAPIVDAGPDTVAMEGAFRSTRTILTDPGDDTFVVSIDYGDDSPVQTFTQTSHNITLDHFYSTPGDYVVTIGVQNEEATVSDSFDLRITEADVTTEFRRVGAPFIKGQPASFEIGGLDPSFQATRYGWSFEMDWGDGTIERVEEFLSFDDSSSNREIRGIVQHTYAEIGEYEVVLTIIDDDGNRSTGGDEISVRNDSPGLAVSVTDAVTEDTPIIGSASASDVDGIASITWDFGDDSPLVTGSDAGHVYAEPGSYTLTVTATDGLGGVTTETRSISVSNVDDPPIVQTIPRQVLPESQRWTYQVVAMDPDAAFGNPMTYLLDDSALAQGLAIDSETGLIQWAPAVTHGPGSYTFDVSVSKGSLSATVPLRIDVLDSASISGTLFEDANGNGTMETGERRLSGMTVNLDIGDDGTSDRSTKTDEDGRYRFDQLPRGLYRVIAEFESAFEATTPVELLYDLAISQQVIAPNLGGLIDSDGDGIANAAERTLRVDGNRDGVPDWQQSHVASLDTSGGVVTIVSNLGTTLSDVSATPALNGSPGESVLPFGRIEFEVSGLPSSGRASVELHFGGSAGINAIFQVDETAPLDQAFRMLGQSETESVDVDFDRLALGIHDGGEADLDGQVNGQAKFSLQPAAVDVAWTNPQEATDVDGEEGTTALDALLIINALRRVGGPYELPLPRPAGHDYLDVNGDGQLSALDALLVINQLRRQHQQRAAGEAIATLSAEVPGNSSTTTESELDSTPRLF